MIKKKTFSSQVLCVSLLITCLAQNVVLQKNEGDDCVVQFTNTAGKCASASQCKSAKDDLQLSGIQPTFCQHSFGSVPLVCCRDGSTILQTAYDAEKPVWDGNNKNDGRRISLRMCDQYSRAVKQQIDFIPLLPDPDTYNLSSAKCDYVDLGLIIGGTNARLGEFPHMAAIGWANYEGGYTFNCGGSLISRRHILSAAHCTADSHAKDPEPVVVRLGDQNIDPSVNDGAKPVEVPIKTIHRHPNYRSPIRYHDIAIFELRTDVDLSSSIRPACLWSRSDLEDGGNNMAIATGWGVSNTDTNTKSDELQKVSLSIIDNEPCDRYLFSLRNRNWNGTIPGQLCAGELRGGKDTCQGDSGSPLQKASKDNYCIFNIIGITSFGGKCAKRERPAIYTRVSYYLDWIEGIVWPGQ